jgi:hypothetical protein
VADFDRYNAAQATLDFTDEEMCVECAKREPGSLYVNVPGSGPRETLENIPMDVGTVCRVCAVRPRQGRRR